MKDLQLCHNFPGIAHPQSLQCAPILRCLSLVSRFSVLSPLRQVWLQAEQVAFRSLRFGDLRAMACCGCSVPFWSLRSSLSLRFGMRLWAVATAKRNSKARAMPPLYAVACTCHFAAFLSPFPPLHTAPCSPCPTAPGRCVPYTPPPPSAHALPPLYSPSCNAPVNFKVRIFQY